MKNKEKSTGLTEEMTGISVRNTSPAAEGLAPEYYSGIDWVSVLFRLLEKIHWIVLAALIGALVA